MGRAVLEGDFSTLDAALGAAARQFADREAYVESERRITFGAWIRAADGLAAAMARRGVGKGDVVALHLDSSIDYAITCAAAVRLGAVATGINTCLGPAEIAGIARTATPRLWIAEDRFALSADSGAAVLRRSEIATLTATAPLPPEERPKILPEQPVVIIWTSGTTGLPKGAWFDHRNLASAVGLAGTMAEPFDRRLASTPFAHAGYMSKLWEQVAFGLTLIISPVPWTAAATLRIMVEERVNVGAGAPTQWAKLLELPEIADADLSAVRLCIAATAPMPSDLAESVSRRFGAPIIVRYAMTECPTISGTSPGDPPEALYHSVGRPLEGVDVRVADESGRPVPAGDIGRVCVRAPCVMRGYWNAPEETAKAFTPDGWLMSSDLGRFNAAGFLVLVGRTSEMYIRGGYNVYPLEVEHVLAEHPEVAQVAVVGAPAPVIGEIGVAFVVPRAAAAPPDLQSLRLFARSQLADYKAPDRLVLLDALPLTSMMKIDKAALKRRL